MGNKEAAFFRQQYKLLMRAIINAIEALRNQQTEQARSILVSAWDSSIETIHKTLILETDL